MFQLPWSLNEGVSGGVNVWIYVSLLPGAQLLILEPDDLFCGSVLTLRIQRLTFSTCGSESTHWRLPLSFLLDCLRFG